MSSKYYYVYILSNFTRTVLYTGITNDLIRRVWEHKQELIEGFSQKYKVHDLIYFEEFTDPISAIEREKQIKNYSRKKKQQLIIKTNSTLKDLYQNLI
jgi:putative endonuclease